VEQTRRNSCDVQTQIRQQVGYLEWMHEIRLARVANLPLVLQRRKHVGATEELDVGLWAVAPDLLEEILEPNHGTGV
jgi:hypothetical protein